MPPQTFANHRRILVGFHVILFAVLAVNAIWSLVEMVRYPSWTSVLACATAVALLCLYFYVRSFPLAVQDRVIRLEMRLRLAALLPPDLKARIPELDRDQLIALRYASDAELPDLVREVLTNNIHSRNEIKRRIKKWEPDDWRA